MQEFFTRIVRQLNDFWEKTEKRDRIRFFTLGGVAIVVIVIAVMFLTRTEYTVLYRDMNPGDAGEVLTILKEMGVTAQPQGSGTILVPAKQADQLRMQLAEQGFPKSGFNYEVFAQGTGFGTTDYEKRKYEQFQKEVRLQNALQLYEGVKQAVVTLSIPDTSRYVFTSDVAPATASVMLYLDQNIALTDEQIEAVELLVATSVENLLPENVSITDNLFRRLNHREGLDFSTLQTNLEYQLAYQNRLISSLRMLLNPIFGADKLEISVNAELDFDSRSADKITFTPVLEDGGIPVSELEEIEKLTGATGVGGAVGMDPNGAAPQYPELTGDGTGAYSRTVRETNYEINQLHEQIESAKGQVKALTVSVAVDSRDMPEDAATAEQVTDLVAGSMGLVGQEELIRVQFVPFATASTSLIDAAIAAAEAQKRLFDLIKTIALYAIIAICLIVLIINTAGIMRKGKSSDAAQVALAQFDNMDAEVDEYGNLIDLATRPADIIDREKTPERALVEEFIDKKPNDAVSLLRNWLVDEKGGR